MAKPANAGPKKFDISRFAGLRDLDDDGNPKPKKAPPAKTPVAEPTKSADIEEPKKTDAAVNLEKIDPK